jgi:hypothetical protein
LREEAQGDQTGEGQQQAPNPGGARQVSFRARAVERDAIVLNNGLATVG